MKALSLTFGIAAALWLSLAFSAVAEEPAECIGPAQSDELRIFADGRALAGSLSLWSHERKQLGSVQHTHSWSRSGDGKVTWRMDITNLSPCKILVDWMAYREEYYGDESHPICCIELPLELEPWKSFSGTRPVVPVKEGERVKIKLGVIP